MSTFKYQRNDLIHYWVEARLATEGVELFPEKGLEGLTKFRVYACGNSYRGGDKEMGHFYFSPMPGCCGVVVSTGSFLMKEFRGYLYGKDFHAIKERVARELGYSCMLATVETSNFPEVIGAAKNGWKLHPAFTNSRTGHQLAVMEKKL